MLIAVRLIDFGFFAKRVLPAGIIIFEVFIKVEIWINLRHLLFRTLHNNRIALFP